MPGHLNNLTTLEAIKAATLSAIHDPQGTLKKIFIGTGATWHDLTEKKQDVIKDIIVIVVIGGVFTLCIITAINAFKRRWGHRDKPAQESPKLSTSTGQKVVVPDWAKQFRQEQTSKNDEKLVGKNPEKAPWADTYQTMATVGAGDCALHAALGVETNKQYVCQDIALQRAKIAEKNPSNRR